MNIIINATLISFQQVFSESVLVLSGDICSSKPSKSHQLSLHIPKNVSHLLSSPRLVVWTQTPGHEIVADSILFLVEHEEEHKVRCFGNLKIISSDKFQIDDGEPYFTQVEIGVSAYFVEIGGKLEIKVKAEPHSEVRAFVTEDMPVFDSEQAEVSKKIASFSKMKFCSLY